MNVKGQQVSEMSKTRKELDHELGYSCVYALLRQDISYSEGNDQIMKAFRKR